MEGFEHREGADGVVEWVKKIEEEGVWSSIYRGWSRLRGGEVKVKVPLVIREETFPVAEPVKPGFSFEWRLRYDPVYPAPAGFKFEISK